VLHFSRLKIFFISLTILIGLFFFIPNFLNTPSKIFPEKKVVLGLDLQGGSYLLLEVDSKPLFQEKIDTKAFDIRKKIRSERINYTNFKINNSRTISFQINLENKNKIEKLLNDKDINSRVDETNKELQFVINDNIVNINFSTAYLQRIKKNAMEQSLEIIRSRIDELGTREPTIIAQGEERILIELPGIKNPKRIKEIIGTTAKLSFKFLANNDANSNSFDILDSKSKLEKFNVEKTLVLSGEHLTDAQPGFDNINNSSVVNFKLDNFGAKKICLCN